MARKRGGVFEGWGWGGLIPQCTLWAVFLEFVQCFFPKLYVVLGFHIRGVCDRSVFFRKNRHQGKMIKNGSYTECFGFLGTSSHYFCLEIVQNETAYGLLTFWENRMLGKNRVLRLWLKMLSVDEISVFFNYISLMDWLLSFIF